MKKSVKKNIMFSKNLLIKILIVAAIFIFFISFVFFLNANFDNHSNKKGDTLGSGEGSVNLFVEGNAENPEVIGGILNDSK